MRFKGHLVKTKEVIGIWDENPFNDIKEAEIDIDNHIVKNVCLFGTRYSKNGYTYQDKAIETLHKLTEGSKFFINHPSNTEEKERDGVRDIRDWAGVFTNPKKKDDKVFADLQVRESYWPLIKDVATMKPAGVGCSINTLVKVYKDDAGKEHIVDIATLKSTDLVSSAATTQNLFESFSNKITENEDKWKDSLHDEVWDIIEHAAGVSEGLLADKLRDKEIARQINKLSWDVSDLIDSIIRDSSVKMTDKKTQISEIMDDFDTEVNKILNGKGESSVEDSSKKTISDNEEVNDMDFKVLTMEDLTKERPDLIETIKRSIENSSNLESITKERDGLKTKVEELTSENDELEKKVESLTSELNELKKKVDEFEVAQKKTQKEAFIVEKIKEMKVPDDVITETFKNDLMTKDNDAIVESLKDRKDIWLKGKGVKGAGEEFKHDSDIEVTKEKKESAKARLKSVVGR